MKISRIIFAVWVFFWLFFLARGFVKGESGEFAEYLFLDASEKRAHILGEGLDAFLETCLKEIPEAATFAFSGNLSEHDERRLVYYLYPRLESASPEYLLRIDNVNRTYMIERER